MNNRGKKLVIPDVIDLTHGSDIWTLLRNSSFSKLRCLGCLHLSNEELDYLRSEFERFVVMTDKEEQFSVEPDRPLSGEMMEKAARELTKRMIEQEFVGGKDWRDGKNIVVLENEEKLPQEFAIEEYDDHIVLVRFYPDGVSKYLSHVDIPNTINGKPVTIIGEECFRGSNNLEEISFPDTITSIGPGAFSFCRNLRELVLPDNITEIGEYCFSDCRGLKKTILPKHLKVLRKGLFSHCHLRDAEFILPPELEIIERNGFWEAGVSYDVVIPESVKVIGRGAFYGGPNPITSLPHDPGWWKTWPYGEAVICQGFDEVGKITDVHGVENGCEVHIVTIGKLTKKFFFPCDYADGIISFVSTENQSTINARIHEFVNRGQNFGITLEEAYKIKNFWKRGIIGEYK